MRDPAEDKRAGWKASHQNEHTESQTSRATECANLGLVYTATQEDTPNYSGATEGRIQLLEILSYFLLFVCMMTICPHYTVPMMGAIDRLDYNDIDHLGETLH